MEAPEAASPSLTAANAAHGVLDRIIQGSESLSEQNRSNLFLQEKPNSSSEFTWWVGFGFPMLVFGFSYVRKLEGNGTFLCSVCKQQKS
jgi:hypothetical protein